ncbi:MAG TPA: hypothetical protein VE398_08405 [Acidobacteriota bacterium]|nr:hypothetical protein [Acidobacteriota bacterium]
MLNTIGWKPMWWVIGSVVYLLLLFAGILFLRAGVQADHLIRRLEGAAHAVSNRGSSPAGDFDRHRWAYPRASGEDL